MHSWIVKSCPIDTEPHYMARHHIHRLDLAIFDNAGELFRNLKNDFHGALLFNAVPIMLNTSMLYCPACFAPIHVGEDIKRGPNGIWSKAKPSLPVGSFSSGGPTISIPSTDHDGKILNMRGRMIHCSCGIEMVLSNEACTILLCDPERECCCTRCITQGGNHNGA